MRALAGGGVAADEIDRIRKDLGLAPAGATDRSLKSRSVRPLTRQQIRAILDRNAAALNAFAAEHGTPGRASARRSSSTARAGCAPTAPGGATR